MVFEPTEITYSNMQASRDLNRVQGAAADNGHRWGSAKTPYSVCYVF